MAKQKQPQTPEQIAELSTLQLMRWARNNAEYWQRRVDKIRKLEHPTANQLECLPWFEQHTFVWAAFAEKMEELERLEAAERARNYQPE